MLKVRAASIEHLEGVFERIGQHGEMRTSIVLSTQYADRPIEPTPNEFLHTSASKGWSRPQDPPKSYRSRGRSHGGTS